MIHYNKQSANNYESMESGFSMTPFVSLNFEGFDPLFFLNDPQNLLFTFSNSYERGHCDPINKNLRENPVWNISFSITTE